MDNNFVATSLLKLINPKEDFSLYLGVDYGIKLQYKPTRKMKEVQGYITKSNSEVNFK